jgi:hypothetical protein
MRTILFSTFVLGALTTAVAAEPVTLTDAQMDKVTAGTVGRNPSASAVTTFARGGKPDYILARVPNDKGTAL